MSLRTETTAAGNTFVMLPPHNGGAAPTLLLLASGGEQTLTTEPYCLVGRQVYERGWNVVSLDLPCHGKDQRNGEPAELDGWAYRLGSGEDIVKEFRSRVNDVVDHLVSSGIADAGQLSVAGTSRGGFMAFHAAAGNLHFRSIIAFAPVTDLLALTEFSSHTTNSLTKSLALANVADRFVDRASWIIIGDTDARVGTDRAIAFADAIAEHCTSRSMTPDVTLHVERTPGHHSLPEWHDLATAWLAGAAHV
jgi:alpha-beta hydrolase superfamily lysophospholipase